MRKNKDWKYYFKFYAMIVVVYFIYVSILAIRDGGYNEYALATVLYLPPLFVVFVVIFDRLLDPVFRKMGRKKLKQSNDYELFLTQMTTAVNETLDLSIEATRRLRENDRFQKSLQQAYRIQTEGETVEMNFILLSKKFKNGTEEQKALEIVMDEVRKTLENQ